MSENRDKERVEPIWKQGPGSRVPVELIMLLALGAVAYLLFLRASALHAMEGALLVMAAAGLLRAGSLWWDWHRGLIQEGFLVDWVHRIQHGDREPQGLPKGLGTRDQRVAAALNSLIEEVRHRDSELADLRRALVRDWQALDGLLEAVQRQQAIDRTVRQQGGARLESLGRDLKAALEDTLQLGRIELNYRLRADQSRLQGQAFRGTLEQVRAGLAQFENHLEELQDTFPRLRREEDALRRLADAGLRQGARLNLSVKGLVAHTSRLVDDAQARSEGLRRLRASADGVRDLTEALARRLGGFREEAQLRIRSFSGAQGSLQELDHVAQQTGLLAVNAAILAQQESGGPGLAAIGERLRSLADQTTEGATGMERMLGDYRHGLEREAAGLWDLQEVAQRLLSEVHELLRAAGRADQQGQELERALESHLGLVDEVHQTSERAELSLHEVGARAMALETAHGRQWSVEAKITPEQERLSRVSTHLAEVGEGLARVSQQNIDDIWDIHARYQEVRRTEAFRQVAAGGLPSLVEVPAGADAVWNGIAWARAQRCSRLEQGGGAPPPIGYRDAGGNLHLQLLGLDALGRPEPSALDSWTCDPTGQDWELGLAAALRTESQRLALLARIKESRVSACFPSLDMRITPEGVRLKLPHPYPGLPEFLAGLRLDLALEADLQAHPCRGAEPRPVEVQRLIWMGPGQGGGMHNAWLRLAHAWIRPGHHHERFLSWLAYRGQGPPCPWPEDDDPEAAPSPPVPIRRLGLGADPAPLGPFLERLLQAGATEGPGGLALCAVSVGHPHPEALLLGLFQQDADLAGAFHPDLIPYQVRLRDEVLGCTTGDPYRAGWSLLEDLQREGWLLPLP